MPGARPTPTGQDRPLAEELTELLAERLPGVLGMRVVDATRDRLVGELDVIEAVCAPNGYLHAATVVTLADTLCGLGTRLTLPDGVAAFTTLELKTNYVGTARAGVISAVAVPAHLGRRTQVWDATVTDDNGRTIALFRCTQLLIPSERTTP